MSKTIATLPAVFRLMLRDDAMLPELAQGDTVDLDSRLADQAVPGDFVLVRDAAGGLFLREYQVQHEGASWTAAALNHDFGPIDEDPGELEILAVMVGRTVVGRRSTTLRAKEAAHG